MKGRNYRLEILWSNGVLTEASISEMEKEFLEKHGGECNGIRKMNKKNRDRYCIP